MNIDPEAESMAMQVGDMADKGYSIMASQLQGMCTEETDGGLAIDEDACIGSHIKHPGVHRG